MFFHVRQLLEMQAHSMKYNLIFSGIPESEDRQVENCETTIKHFINKILLVEGDVEFQNIHRLRPRVDGKPRPLKIRLYFIEWACISRSFSLSSMFSH
jgi:hypothetical protein